MSETSFIRRRWKLLLNIATITALILLGYAIRHQLADTLENVTKVKALVLLLLIPVEVLNYHAQARLYQRVFALVGEKLSYGKLLNVSLELNFVNHVFPSGGVSGISYFGFRLRQLGVSGTKATLVQTIKLLLLFISFEPVLLFGMVALSIRGHSNNLVILLGTALTSAIITGTALFIYIIGSKARINGFLTAITVALNRVIQLARPKHPETINIEQARGVFDQFHEEYILLSSQYRQLKQPLWWAFVANITEVLAVYVVYIAFGSFVNLGAVILAYAVANFAGLVSVLPGGVGIFEALMTATLLVGGVPAGLSLPVTVMYRVLNTLLQVPPGYVLYHMALHQKSQGSEPVNEA